MKSLFLVTMMVMSAESLAKNTYTLPFKEPIKLQAVYMKKPLKANLLASYKGIHLEESEDETAVARVEMRK